MTREAWYPSNSVEGELIQQRYCNRCEEDRYQDCEIITSAQTGIQPEQWTADHCSGKGFKCSKFTQRIKKEN